MVCKFKFVHYGQNKRKIEDPGSRLPWSKTLLWEPTPKFKILILGADSQGQNLYSGSRLPSSKSLLWEPAPKLKILTLGADSQKPGSQMFTPAGRPYSPIPMTISKHSYCNSRMIFANSGNVFFRWSFRQYSTPPVKLVN